ncbi:MAG: hypothetical protein HC935_03365 [Pseudanabaena sp. SU_2_4]|nr:hypothetical protein [Pseudanabaena sp. SU_2_4]
MHHPFELEISDLETMDLDFEEHLTDENVLRVEGGIAVGEYYPPTPTIPSGSKPTTLALGEEGGGGYTTLALGEEGGGGVI